MRRYQKTFLSVLVFLLFIFCSYGLAQDTEILTDENYRQEIQKYMVNPCIEGVFTYMVKKDMLNACVEDELENYREFHQNYGDMTDSP